jgi:hypothetical protein
LTRESESWVIDIHWPKQLLNQDNLADMLVTLWTKDDLNLIHERIGYSSH